MRNSQEKRQILTTRAPVRILSVLIAIPMALLVFPALAAPRPTTNRATVTIDTDAVGQIHDRMIFGGFLEHFDNQIYGGVFEPRSPLADEKGFRSDVIEALKELKVSVIRWPGGCFADAYHWRHGVGEDRRPYGDPRRGVIESNAFGTHEFVEFCRRLGAEPYICHNGLADVQENVDWVACYNATEGHGAERQERHRHSTAPLASHHSCQMTMLKRPRR